MNRDRIEALIPHADGMCLLDRAVAWDAATIDCRSERHHDPEHPLQRVGRVTSVHLIEYGAQAAALHNALLAAEAGGPAGGVLAELRDVALGDGDAAALAGPIAIHATAELRTGQGLIYRFRITGDGRELATGRLTIVTAG